MKFEFVNGKLHHYPTADNVFVVVELENLDAYREFVPETPNYVEGGSDE